MPGCMHHLERVDARKFDGRRWHCRKCDHFYKISTGIIVRWDVGPVSRVLTHDFRFYPPVTGRLTSKRSNFDPRNPAVIGLARCAALMWLRDIYSEATTDQLTLANRTQLGFIIGKMEA